MHNSMMSRLERLVGAIINFSPSGSCEITDDALNTIGLALYPKTSPEDLHFLGAEIREDWCCAVYYLAHRG